MNEKNLRDVLIAFGKAVRSACHEAAMVRQSISGAKWDRFTAGKCAEAVSMVNTDAIADRYASQFIGIVALETERLTFDPDSRYTGNVFVVYDNGNYVPVRLTLGSEGVECAGYASQVKQRVRTHTESQLAEVERVRESHQKFVEETGIDYAALASSGFDANSGAQVQPEPVNQQMLEALKRIGGMTMSMYVSAGEAMSDAKRLANEAIAAAEQAQQADHIDGDLKFDTRELYAQPQAEPVALSRPFFAYDSEVGFERFATEAGAKEFVQQGIDEYRSLADDGWPEEVYSLCWGVVLGTAREVALPDSYDDGAFGLAGAAQFVDYVPLYAKPPAVAVPDGYVLVPVDPTPEMIEAGAETDPQFFEHAKFVYRAMLSAAQKGGA